MSYLKSLSLFLLLFLLLGSCESAAPKAKETPASVEKKADEHHGRTSNWTDKQMEFQITYCHQIMSKIQETDIEGYCTCFLDKVKYYYKTEEVLHAYRQEKEFSQQCMDEFYYGEREN